MTSKKWFSQLAGEDEGKETELKEKSSEEINPSWKAVHYWGEEKLPS